MASPFNDGWYVSLAITSIWQRLHVTQNFVCSCASRRLCRIKLVDIVPRKDNIHLLATVSKLVASLTRDWRRCFTFCQKVIQFVWTRKESRGKSLGLINCRSQKYQGRRTSQKGSWEINSKLPENNFLYDLFYSFQPNAFPQKIFSTNEFPQNAGKERWGQRK